MKLKHALFAAMLSIIGFATLQPDHTYAAQIGIGTDKQIVQNPLEMKREKARITAEKNAERKAKLEAKERAEEQRKIEQAKKIAERKAAAAEKKALAEEKKAADRQVAKASTRTEKPERNEAKAAGGRVEMFETTAYTNDAALNGTYDGKVLTASGYDVTNTILYEGRRIVAVDPNVIPLGTKVHVEGFGDAIAIDTGGVIDGRIMDLMMETEEEAIQWGRRTVEVTIY